jgi:hypothetical protein
MNIRKLLAQKSFITPSRGRGDGGRRRVRRFAEFEHRVGVGAPRRVGGIGAKRDGKDGFGRRSQTRRRPRHSKVSMLSNFFLLSSLMPRLHETAKISPIAQNQMER